MTEKILVLGDGVVFTGSTSNSDSHVVLGSLAEYEATFSAPQFGNSNVLLLSTPGKVKRVITFIKDWDPDKHPHGYHGWFIDTPSSEIVPLDNTTPGDVVATEAGVAYQIDQHDPGAKKTHVSVINRHSGEVKQQTVTIPHNSPDIAGGVAILEKAKEPGTKANVSDLPVGAYFQTHGGDRYMIYDAAQVPGVLPQSMEAGNLENKIYEWIDSVKLEPDAFGPVDLGEGFTIEVQLPSGEWADDTAPNLIVEDGHGVVIYDGQLENEAAAAIQQSYYQQYSVKAMTLQVDDNGVPLTTNLIPLGNGLEVTVSPPKVTSAIPDQPPIQAPDVHEYEAKLVEGLKPDFMDNEQAGVALKLMQEWDWTLEDSGAESMLTTSDPGLAAEAWYLAWFDQATGGDTPDSAAVQHIAELATVQAKAYQYAQEQYLKKKNIEQLYPQKPPELKSEDYADVAKQWVDELGQIGGDRVELYNNVVEAVDGHIGEFAPTEGVSEPATRATEAIDKWLIDVVGSGGLQDTGVEDPVQLLYDRFGAIEAAQKAREEAYNNPQGTLPSEDPLPPNMPVPPKKYPPGVSADTMIVIETGEGALYGPDEKLRDFDKVYRVKRVTQRPYEPGQTLELFATKKEAVAFARKQTAHEPILVQEITTKPNENPVSPEQVNFGEAGLEEGYLLPSGELVEFWGRQESSDGIYGYVARYGTEGNTPWPTSSVSPTRKLLFDKDGKPTAFLDSAMLLVDEEIHPLLTDGGVKKAPEGMWRDEMHARGRWDYATTEVRKAHPEKYLSQLRQEWDASELSGQPIETALSDLERLGFVEIDRTNATDALKNQIIDWVTGPEGPLQAPKVPEAFPGYRDELVASWDSYQSDYGQLDEWLAGEGGYETANAKVAGWMEWARTVSQNGEPFTQDEFDKAARIVTAFRDHQAPSTVTVMDSNRTKLELAMSEQLVGKVDPDLAVIRSHLAGNDWTPNLLESLDHTVPTSDDRRVQQVRDLLDLTEWPSTADMFQEIQDIVGTDDRERGVVVSQVTESRRMPEFGAPTTREFHGQLLDAIKAIDTEQTDLTQPIKALEALNPERDSNPEVRNSHARQLMYDMAVRHVMGFDKPQEGPPVKTDQEYRDELDLVIPEVAWWMTQTDRPPEQITGANNGRMHLLGRPVNDPYYEASTGTQTLPPGLPEDVHQALVSMKESWLVTGLLAGDTPTIHDGIAGDHGLVDYSAQELANPLMTVGEWQDLTVPQVPGVVGAVYEAENGDLFRVRDFETVEVLAGGAPEVQTLPTADAPRGIRAAYPHRDVYDAASFLANQHTLMEDGESSRLDLLPMEVRHRITGQMEHAAAVVLDAQDRADKYHEKAAKSMRENVITSEIARRRNIDGTVAELPFMHDFRIPKLDDVNFEAQTVDEITRLAAEVVDRPQDVPVFFTGGLAEDGIVQVGGRMAYTRIGKEHDSVLVQRLLALGAQRAENSQDLSQVYTYSGSGELYVGDMLLIEESADLSDEAKIEAVKEMTNGMISSDFVGYMNAAGQAKMREALDAEAPNWDVYVGGIQQTLDDLAFTEESGLRQQWDLRMGEIQSKGRVKKIEYVSHAQQGDLAPDHQGLTTGAATSQRGQVRLYGFTPEEAITRMQELGIVHDLEPEVPFRSIFRSGRRTGRVLPLLSEYVRGDHELPVVGEQLTHGVTGGFDDLEKILESGAVLSISERIRLDLVSQVNSGTSQKGDVRSGIDMGVFGRVGNPAWGSNSWIYLRDDALLRRDIIVSDQDFGGDPTRYDQYVRYMNQMRRAANEPEDGLTIPLGPGARQKHLNSGTGGSNEWNVHHEIPIEDWEILVVPSEQVKRVKFKLRGLLESGYISQAPHVTDSKPTADRENQNLPSQQDIIEDLLATPDPDNTGIPEGGVRPGITTQMKHIPFGTKVHYTNPAGSPYEGILGPAESPNPARVRITKDKDNWTEPLGTEEATVLEIAVGPTNANPSTTAIDNPKLSSDELQQVVSSGTKVPLGSVPEGSIIGAVTGKPGNGWIVGAPGQDDKGDPIVHISEMGSGYKSSQYAGDLVKLKAVPLGGAPGAVTQLPEWDKLAEEEATIGPGDEPVEAPTADWVANDKPISQLPMGTQYFLPELKMIVPEGVITQTSGVSSITGTPNALNIYTPPYVKLPPLPPEWVLDMDEHDLVAWINDSAVVTGDQYEVHTYDANADEDAEPGSYIITKVGFKGAAGLVKINAPDGTQVGADTVQPGPAVAEIQKHFAKQHGTWTEAPKPGVYQPIGDLDVGTSFKYAGLTGKVLKKEPGFGGLVTISWKHTGTVSTMKPTDPVTPIAHEPVSSEGFVPNKKSFADLPVGSQIQVVDSTMPEPLIIEKVDEGHLKVVTGILKEDDGPKGEGYVYEMTAKNYIPKNAKLPGLLPNEPASTEVPIGDMAPLSKAFIKTDGYSGVVKIMGENQGTGGLIQYQAVDPPVPAQPYGYTSPKTLVKPITHAVTVPGAGQAPHNFDPHNYPKVELAELDVGVQFIYGGDSGTVTDVKPDYIEVVMTGTEYGPEGHTDLVTYTDVMPFVDNSLPWADLPVGTLYMGPGGWVGRKVNDTTAEGVIPGKGELSVGQAPPGKQFESSNMETYVPKFVIPPAGTVPGLSPEIVDFLTGAPPATPEIVDNKIHDAFKGSMADHPVVITSPLVDKLVEADTAKLSLPLHWFDRLRDKGYTDEKIFSMSPAEIIKVLNG